jgi:tyrosinase
MNIEININGQPSNAAYIGWSPQPSTIRLTAAQATPVNVLLKSISGIATGSVVFLTARNSQPVTSLPLTIPADGTSINFYVAGQTASTGDQDTIIVATDAATGVEYGRTTLMVRIRKNANTLTINERDRFLSAMTKFNLSQGTPNYTDFLIMHNNDANTEIHTTSRTPRCSFLAWHRAFILDLERQLQKFDPSVSLPYWKFDEPAPNVFTADFMGAARSTGSLMFNASNPLVNWTVEGKIGVIRKPIFNVQTSSASDPQVGALNESDTIALGADYLTFSSSMEQNPHGAAHESFSTGPITDITKATQDPIFFLLHANVDRLWALWQHVNDRYDISDINTYPIQGAFIKGKGTHKAGDYIDDTMWPWNGISSTTDPGSTRPPSAPGGQFPQTVFASTPSAKPVLWEMIDYQGYSAKTKPNGFDYDMIIFNDQNVMV